ncbi:MAG TPA: hypothetical protein VG455_14550 [Acidimicrobiales bacterium]|nr:hypothetical protein [Acidimicrobiales bacterium]
MAAPKLPHEVIVMMADRDVRMHHYLWHQVRNMWLFYDEATRDEIRALGWEPPRPGLRPGPDGRPQIAFDNDSGEDFLYMHRQMIAEVNKVLARVGDPCYPSVMGWAPIPRPDDADYPVPPPWDTGDDGFNAYLEEVKSVEHFEADFVTWEQRYTDPEQLRQWSLGQFGTVLEYTIHNEMHMRWAAEPAAMRPDVGDTSPDDIDPSWDDPAYDYLGDTYSSHVNPVFWKLHGWIDDRIEDWRLAHGLDEVTWTGTWVGNMPHGHEGEDPHALLTSLPDTPALSGHEHGHHTGDMGKVLAAVKRSGTFHQFRTRLDL